MSSSRDFTENTTLLQIWFCSVQVALFLIVCFLSSPPSFLKSAPLLTYFNWQAMMSRRDIEKGLLASAPSFRGYVQVYTLQICEYLIIMKHFEPLKPCNGLNCEI